MLNQLGRNTGQRLLRILPAPAPSWQKVPGPELPAAMVPMARGATGERAEVTAISSRLCGEDSGLQGARASGVCV